MAASQKPSSDMATSPRLDHYYTWTDSSVVGNLHTVPVTDLLTVDTVAVIGIGVLIAKSAGFSWVGLVIVLILLLIFSIILHVNMGVPTNLAYFFQLGHRPASWRGYPKVPCACMVQKNGAPQSTA